MEIWAYPFQIVKSLQVSFRPQGVSSEMSGRELLRRVIYSPETTTRIYTGPDFVIREELFAPLDEPGAIISYEVDAERPVDIVVRFTPVLDLMWPASIGGQEAVWSSPLSSYVISEPLHRFTAIIGSTDIVAHDDTQNYNRNLNLSQGLAFTLRVEPHKTGRLVIAGDNSETALKAAAQQLRSHHDALLNSYVKHDSDLLRHTLQVETPDDEVNRALAWAEIALDQAWVCNPDLGCAEVGGYGPSRKARRPQYDWFFAGDGMAAVQALLADGSYDQARQELEFILKYQNPKTGMIWHELSQSAAWLDWKTYPYLFLHVDLTYEFLIAVRDYLSRTGDLDFAKSHWDAIQLAYQYCRSLIDPLTGLPQIPSEKRGEREQEELSDELALSANWMMASKAFATLAEATGHSDLAQLSTSQQLGQTILHRYWDEKQHAWISGYTRSGSPLPLRGIGPVGLLEELP